MSRARKLAAVVAAAVMALTAVEVGGHLMGIGWTGIVAPAQAVVGRPLTPVSVAGVGRRTVRRCAAGVYNC